MGSYEPLVRRLRPFAADVHHDAGDHELEGRLYDEALAYQAVPDAGYQAAEARLGRAECHVWLGAIDSALTELRAAVAEAVHLDAEHRLRLRTRAASISRQLTLSGSTDMESVINLLTRLASPDSGT